MKTRRTYALPDQHLMEILGEELLVACPDCGRMAGVFYRHGDFTFLCSQCGAVKQRPYRGPRAYRGDWPLLVGAPYDPIFGFPVWLRANFRGHLFFAYSRPHLAFLEDAIAAELRPASPGGGRRLRNKLPKWMLLARNRAGLLKLVQKLREKNFRPV